MADDDAIRNRVRELRHVRASDLIRNVKNWRTHPRQQLTALRGVLADIGYADALIARDTPEGLVLIDGHLRAETTPDAVVPVLIVDLTDEEADKLLLTLDPLAAMAEADRGRLADLLALVTTEDAGVRLLLERIARDGGVTAPLLPGNTDPDDAPPLPAEPTSVLGDVWLLGPHRLLVGDATNEQDHDRLMGMDVARLLVTDPPYGVKLNLGLTERRFDKAANRKQNQRNPRYAQLARPLANDSLSDAEQATFWQTAFRLARFEGDAYIFSASGPPMIPMAAAIVAAGIQHHQWLVWDKEQFVLSSAHFHYRHEHIFYGWRGRSSWQGSRKEDSVWQAHRPYRSPDHPTIKPVALFEKALLCSSQAGDIVLDPFVGSGTAIIAAERLGRRCFAMELDPRYSDVAVRRWEQFSGKRAERETA